MTTSVVYAVVLGAGTGLGLLLILRGIAGPGSEHEASFTRPSRLSRWLAARGPGDGRRLAVAVAVGLVVGVWTRWPVAAVLAAVGAWVLPGLIGPDREHKRRLAPALRALAIELDDATGDLVVTALVMAAERNARHIGELLTSLATAARDQASLRMRVMAGRARIRTSSRVITAVTLTMAGGLVLLNRRYLSPYDTPTGQLVLLVVGGFFAFGFAWLSRISRVTEPERVLGVVAAEPAQLSEVGS